MKFRTKESIESQLFRIVGKGTMSFGCFSDGFFTYTFKNKFANIEYQFFLKQDCDAMDVEFVQDLIDITDWTKYRSVNLFSENDDLDSINIDSIL